ncbi:hypothetical protein GCM10010916_16500 [Paenibacillus abyssi]|uniref:Cold-shock protein n=1 Tax=Paenibacillus abyssi TaxID=1340531 RepID=A0A917FTE7_9BACL|nr:hypothetical protein GCM10010916_16500 [Paenibacillus abyssi]
MSTDAEIKPELLPTKIYKCKSPDCKAWVREEFATEQQSCPICKGPMLRSIRHLPPIGKPKKKRASKSK